MLYDCKVLAMEIENNNSDIPSRNSIDSTDSSGGSPVTHRNISRFSNFWRSRSLRKKNVKRNPPVLEAIPSMENLDIKSNESTSNESSKVDKAVDADIKDTIVTVVLIEAKGLPEPPDDGATHGLYCKIGLGSKSFKSKTSPNTLHPEWGERFELQLSKDHLLKMSLWDKGKQKTFMGRCVLDLTDIEKDRTHEIWQQLEDGYGLLHISLTMCNKRNNDIVIYNTLENKNEVKEKYALHNLSTDWKIIGQLHVKVICAKGLRGKPSAYCTLEVDNQRVQTHSVRASSNPMWEKSYIFDVYDITSTLDLKMYDSSLVNQIRNESLGRLSIPLLRISNRTLRWYALKDRIRRNSARGHCPRVLLEMSIFWNPVKAAVRMFRPKEVKYIKKPPKFNLSLVHNNMMFIKDTFIFLYDINEAFKRLFEWDNMEVSFVALLGWLIFWYHITLWAVPLLVLLPFFYHWAYRQNLNETSLRNVYNAIEDKAELSENEKDDKTLTLGKLQGLPEMTMTIKEGVDYMVSAAERLYNLATFKVPFLSYLTMLLLVATSLALYFIPFNYLMMALGIYKFTRKYLDPNRTLNNDLLDFISRVPDNCILRDWKELSVPEPLQRSDSSSKVESLSFRSSFRGK